MKDHRTADDYLKEAETYLDNLRDLVNADEFHKLESSDPDSTYNVEDLKADYLYELMVAQSAQAIATIALTKAVLDVASVLREATYQR